MKRRNQIVVYLATAFLGIALPSSSPAQQKRQPPPPPQRGQVTAPHAERPRGHAGDFLRRYGDLPPDEQEQALENDPDFHRLPVERQQKYRQRLQHFSSLPPEAQLKILNRMETWEHLTPEQKQEARQLFGQFRQLPPDRQHMLKTAVDDLRAMPPDQRDHEIDSDKFKGMFSDQERELMRGAARLPLAPPQAEGPQE